MSAFFNHVRRESKDINVWYEYVCKNRSTNTIMTMFLLIGIFVLYRYFVVFMSLITKKLFILDL